MIIVIMELAQGIGSIMAIRYQGLVPWWKSFRLLCWEVWVIECIMQLVGRACEFLYDEVMGYHNDDRGYGGMIVKWGVVIMTR